MKLDIVITIYNEEKKIEKYYNDLKDLLSKIKYNLIFVDNASTDNTLERLKSIYKTDDDKIKIISLTKHENDNTCFQEGLKYTKSDLVAVMNINDNIKYILKMYDFLIENNEYDSVCICKKDNNISFFRKTKINIINKLTGINHIDEMTNLKMFRKNMIQYIIKISEEKGYSNAVFSFLGFNIYYDYSYDKKIDKEDLSKYIFNYSFKPLKLIIYFGLFIAILSILYFIYIVMFSFNILSFIIFIISFFSGLNILFIGIIGNYLAKIFKKNCSLPSFIIKEKIGFDEKYL